MEVAIPAFGIHVFVNERTVQPAEVARAAEVRGFESIFLGEHTHVPARRATPYIGVADPRPPQPGETDKELRKRRPDLLVDFWRMYDPWIALASAAVVTERIKLGTAISLIPERDPIVLAKELATLDRISNGRVVLGIGSGWNPEEMANHGVAFKDRFKVMRERVLAMKAIWSEDEPEFHGEFVDFDPIWSFPKPMQPGGPPVLLGSHSPRSYARIAEYCDGWIPNGPAPVDLGARLEALREAGERAGRAPEALSVTVYGPRLDEGEEAASAEVRRLLDLGIDRILFNMHVPRPGRFEAMLDQYAEFMSKFE